MLRVGRRALFVSQARYTGVTSVHRSLQTSNIPKEIEHLFAEEDKMKDRRRWTAPWIVEKFPESVRPYLHLMRADKPVGTWLLFWPGAISIAMATASGFFPAPALVASFAVGSFIMRSAGCIVNDMWDRELDAKVERTKDRPLASGEITMPQASALLAAHFGAGLAILSQLDPACWAVGAASFAMFGAYPAMKRITNYPQAWLGLTFNWGVPLGWAAATGAMHLPVVLPLHASLWCWTMVYDTIYAHQDRKDDIEAGIKSTAVTWGEEGTRKRGQQLAVAGSALFSLAGYMASMPMAFHVFGPTVFLAHMTHQIQTVDFKDEKDCGAKFRSNAALGAYLFFITSLCSFGGSGNSKGVGEKERDFTKMGYNRAEERVHKIVDYRQVLKQKEEERMRLEQEAKAAADEKQAKSNGGAGVVF